MPAKKPLYKVPFKFMKIHRYMWNPDFDQIKVHRAFCYALNEFKWHKYVDRIHRPAGKRANRLYILYDPRLDRLQMDMVLEFALEVTHPGKESHLVTKVVQ